MTVSIPTPTLRVTPPLIADERAMLAAWLDYHRATLETKCTGVSEKALRERLEGHPSPLSLLGLVRRMADVERAWFRRGVAAEDAPPRYYPEDDPDGDFDNVDVADVAEPSLLGKRSVGVPGRSSRSRCRWTTRSTTGASACRCGG